jgi:hypothetical protein
MGSLMTGDQFTVEVLNSLTRDYKILMLLLHKQIGDKKNPLTVGDLNETLLFRYMASAADLTTLLCKTVTKSFFKILNVNRSPTLSSNPKKYPGFLWFLKIEILRLDTITVKV